MTSLPDCAAHNYQLIHELGRNYEGGRITYVATNLNQNQNP